MKFAFFGMALAAVGAIAAPADVQVRTASCSLLISETTNQLSLGRRDA